MHDQKHIAEMNCEEECTSGTRNHYFLGKRMKPKSFQVEQDYQIARRHLINRAVHGWGVVYGFALEAAAGAPGKLQTGQGLALDRSGRELVQTAPRTLSLADLYLSPQDRKKAESTPRPAQGEGDTPQQDTCWLLRVHYAEKREAPVRVSDPCHCERDEWDYVCETVWYSLQPQDCAECMQFAEPCALCCDCPEECAHRPDAVDRGPHRCLCDHLTQLHPGSSQDMLCEIKPGLRVDLYNGVPLACVTLKWDDCNQIGIDQVLDACAPRRLVKRNDLLFDLIRGCDLTRISEISWADWHRRTDLIEWAQFAAYFNPPGGPTKFKVAFSGPVQRETLGIDCFAMTVIVLDERSGWGNMMRVPITAIDIGEVDGKARSATLAVDQAWVADEVNGHHSAFHDGPLLVEIEVRGDFILDDCGQAVDANAVGIRPPRANERPTGNGTPGGSFLSTFRVGQKPSGYPPSSSAT